MLLDSVFAKPEWVVIRSNDFGNTFSKEVKASGFSGGEACDCCPGTLLSASDKMVMLYRDNLSNVRDSWAEISADSGKTFSLGINADMNNWVIPVCPASGPDGIIVNDTLYSVFMSGAGGKSFVYHNKTPLAAPVSSLSDSITGNFTGLSQQNFPRIAHHDTIAAVVWKQATSSNSIVPLLFSSNIHKGFTTLYDTVAIGNLSAVVNADVAVGGDAVHVVWQDNSSGTVKYRKGFWGPGSGMMDQSFFPRLKIFPNPARDKVEVVFGQIVSENYSAAVFDYTGKLVAVDAEMDNKGFRFSVSALSSGIYFVKVNSANYSFSGKLQVMR